MLVETKAKAGVFSIALGAYLEQFKDLRAEFESQYEDFKKSLPDTVEVVDGGLITTKEEAMAAGDKFRAADVDVVFLQMLTYATSYNVLPVVRDLNVPVVVVNIQKMKAPDYKKTDIPTWLGTLYACGAVGEAAADLERAGKRYAVVTGVAEGGDAEVAKEILDTFEIEGGGSVEKVWEMARYVVAFERWAKDESLALVASHYAGKATGQAGILDSMLIPAFSMLIKQGTACAVEGDIKVAMAMSILKTIAGTGQLSEMYSIDFNKDICIIGHSGSGEADISKAHKPTMKIVEVFHGKVGGGYLTQFYPPAGDVTYLAITQDKDGKFKFVVAEGVNEEGDIFTFGDTNMRTRFSCGAREFVNRWSEAGPTHHMAAAIGRHTDVILKVAKILDIPVEVVTR